MNGISVQALEKVYIAKRGRRIHAVRGLDFEIRRGGLVALLGPNGAGKSTTVRMICGLCRPTAGRIRVADLDPERERTKFLGHIGLVSQHFNVDEDLTGYENLIVHAHLFGMKGAAVKTRIRDLLDFADLSESGDRKVSSYSGGMKRKLQIVRTMLHEPEVLILDEPTVGLDPAARMKIWDLITELNGLGRTVLFTTHYIDEAEHRAERVIVMDHGRIIADGKPVELIDRLGPWCRESFSDGKTRRAYFSDRSDAELEGSDGYDRLLIRRTQLEDVFISITGESIGAEK